MTELFQKYNNARVPIKHIYVKLMSKSVVHGERERDTEREREREKP